MAYTSYHNTNGYIHVPIDNPTYHLLLSNFKVRFKDFSHMYLLNSGFMRLYGWESYQAMFELKLTEAESVNILRVYNKKQAMLTRFKYGF